MNARQKELAEERFGGIAVCDNIACKGCVFAYPNDPQNSNCEVYTPENGLKPHDVYFFGKSCPFRKTEADLN